MVISDEDYRQRATGRLHLPPQDRRTRSEMLFLWMPDEAAWLTVRSVQSADGRLVADSQHRLQSVLGDNGTERLTRLRRLLDESARFNLGRIVRNFNYPTLALGYLDPSMQSRFAFTPAGRERVNGIDAWKIEVDYGRDAKLDMWVPTRMHETYLQSRSTMINEAIDCVATYSNFRRFETSGRIVK